MNNKVKQMPGDFDGFAWQYKLVGPIFKVVLAIIDTILKIEPIATKIFDNVCARKKVSDRRLLVCIKILLAWTMLW